MRFLPLQYISIRYILILIIVLLTGCSSNSSNNGNEIPAAESVGLLTASIDIPAGKKVIRQGLSIDLQGSIHGGIPPFIYLWTFGDNERFSNAQDPGKVFYEISGTYTITFTVMDSSGSCSADSITLTVDKSCDAEKIPDNDTTEEYATGYTDTTPEPTIEFPLAGETVYEHEYIHFHAAVDGGNPPLACLWDFDGGAEDCAEKDPGIVQFNTAGTYNVTLSVTDNDGDKAAKSVVVMIKEAPNPAEALYGFFMDPGKEDLNDLIHALSIIEDSYGEDIYNIFAQLVRMYSDPSHPDPLSELEPMNLPGVFAQGLNNTAWQMILSDTPQELIGLALNDIGIGLGIIDERLSQGQNVSTTICPGDSVETAIDDIDITVMRSIIQLMMALSSYLQAIDMGVTDYNITKQGSDPAQYVDIRELSHRSATLDQLEEFIGCNPGLLTYINRDDLTDIRTHLSGALDHLGSTISALDRIGEQGRAARADNLFSLDTELEYRLIRTLYEHCLPSVLSSIDDPTADLTLIHAEYRYTTQAICADPDTEIDLYNICLDYYTPSYMGLYELLNPDGRYSPRDLCMDILETGDEGPYLPYLFDGSVCLFEDLPYIRP